MVSEQARSEAVIPFARSSTKNRLFAFLAALSLLACVATIGAWIRSHWVYDEITYAIGEQHVHQTRFIAHSGAGGVCLCVEKCWHKPPKSDSDRPPGFRWTPFPVADDSPATYPIGQGQGRVFGDGSLAHRLGFEIQNFQLGRPGTWFDEQHILTVPYWFVALLLAVLPFIWVRRQRRLARRRRHNLCLNCGYDLRASHDRCPECGMPIPPSARALADNESPMNRAVG